MYRVGIDLGATNVRAVVGDDTGQIQGSARGETPENPTEVNDKVVQIVREACTEAGVKPDSIRSAGIGTMGKIDASTGVVHSSANIDDDITPIHLVEPVSDILKTQDVYLCSDTLAGAIGEYYFAYPEVDNIVYLTISSGIGAGVISNGVPILGSKGNAGEVGHITIDFDGQMTCGCGRKGHWEAYCSGNNIPDYTQTIHNKNPVPTSVPIDQSGFDAEKLFEYAGVDSFADYVIDQIAHLNTIGVANIVHTFEPEIITIGGAVALNNPTQVVKPIRKQITEHVLVDTPKIRTSELGQNAVLKGALAISMGEISCDPQTKPSKN